MLFVTLIGLQIIHISVLLQTVCSKQSTITISSSLETLYLRRRTLLLQEKSKQHASTDESTRKNYLQLRSIILHDRYGLSKDILCSRSRSVSSRGMSISSADMKNTSLLEERYMVIHHMLDQVLLWCINTLFWCLITLLVASRYHFKSDFLQGWEISSGCFLIGWENIHLPNCTNM